MCSLKIATTRWTRCQNVKLEFQPSRSELQKMKRQSLRPHQIRQKRLCKGCKELHRLLFGHTTTKPAVSRPAAMCVCGSRQQQN